MFAKKILLGTLASAVVFSAFAPSAKADERCGDRPYAAVRTGVAMLKNHIDKNAWEGSVAIGTQLNAFRAEMEYTYRDKIKGDHNRTKHEIGSMSLMANGYYDMRNHTRFTPFVNLAAGASRLHMKDAGVSSNTDYRFSWGGGVGVGYDIAKSATFDLGYRFLDLGKDVKSNEFYAGLRFAF